MYFMEGTCSTDSYCITRVEIKHGVCIMGTGKANGFFTIYQYLITKNSDRNQNPSSTEPPVPFMFPIPGLLPPPIPSFIS